MPMTAMSWRSSRPLGASDAPGAGAAGRAGAGRVKRARGAGGAATAVACASLPASGPSSAPSTARSLSRCVPAKYPATPSIVRYSKKIVFGSCPKSASRRAVISRMLSESIPYSTRLTAGSIAAGSWWSTSLRWCLSRSAVRSRSSPSSGSGAVTGSRDVPDVTGAASAAGRRRSRPTVASVPKATTT